MPAKIIWLLITALLPLILVGCDNKTGPTLPNGSAGPVHKLVFAAHDQQGTYKLYTINDDGTELREFFTSDNFIGDLWVSPEGNRVVCVVDTSDHSEADYELFVINIDGSGATQITGDNNTVIEEPQWFPDGDEILFGLWTPSGGQMYRIRADGANMTRITTDDNISHRFPRLSPNGQQVAHERRGTPQAIWVVNADGSGETPLTPAGVDASLGGWTPDGTSIIYLNVDERNVWLVKPDGSNRRKISEYFGFVGVAASVGRIALGNYQGVYTIDLDGSVSKKISDSVVDGYPILWSPDGTKITFRGDINGDLVYGICKINANGTNLVEVTPPALELVRTPARAFDWMP